MRRILYSFFLTFALANTALQADYDQIDLTNTELPSGNSDNGLGILQGGSGMFAIEANSDHIRPAKFKKKDIKHEEVSFTGFDIDASMVFYYDKENHEAVNVEVGYNRTNIHWKENPYFDQNIFNTATVSVNAQTSRMCNWLWKGKIAFNVDTDHFDIQEYSTWDFFAWGDRKSVV